MPHLDRRLALVDGLQPQARAGLVDHVDGLVGHVPFVDVARGELGRGANGIVRVGDAVVLLEARLQAHEDVDGLRHRGLDHVDLLEAARQRVILLEDAAVFLVGGRADAAQLAVGEHRLDEIGGIHDAARRRAGADDGVDLVDEEDGARLLLELADDALQPLLEIAAILGAGDQRAHVERIDSAVRQHVGDFALDDHARQPFGNGRFSYAGFAHVQRIVLAAPAQDLDGAFHLERAADQRIDLAVLGELVEIGGVFVERAAAVAVAIGAFAARLFLRRLLFGDLREAVRDEIDHVEARDLGAIQQMHRVALLFTEDGDEHVGDADFFLARRLHVEHGALQDALETERGLHFAVFVIRAAAAWCGRDAR